ncbi:MAG TPA: peptidylprolyl isomerase [Stellaceae bacterium]|nr:peptidylprolyl isomerase [Stellaceae bacterium]
MLEEAGRLGIAADVEAASDESSEEDVIQALLAREIAVPEPDDETCKRYWAANEAKFRSPELYEAAHILFPAQPDDKSARDAAKQAAMATIDALKGEPSRFAALARERSACPSGAAGGLLGQQTRGDLVPELETFIIALEEGQICPVPVPTRYGFHVLRLDRIVRGKRPPFESVAAQIAQQLSARAWRTGVSRYLRALARQADVEGLEIGGEAA